MDYNVKHPADENDEPDEMERLEASIDDTIERLEEMDPEDVGFISIVAVTTDKPSVHAGDDADADADDEFESGFTVRFANPSTDGWDHPFELMKDVDMFNGVLERHKYDLSGDEYVRYHEKKEALEDTHGLPAALSGLFE